MPVSELEARMSHAEQLEWYAEDLTRAADDRDARAEMKRLHEMTPEERIAAALQEQASEGLDAMQRKKRR